MSESSTRRCGMSTGFARQRSFGQVSPGGEQGGLGLSGKTDLDFHPGDHSHGSARRRLCYRKRRMRRRFQLRLALSPRFGARGCPSRRADQRRAAGASLFEIRVLSDLGIRASDSRSRQGYAPREPGNHLCSPGAERLPRAGKTAKSTLERRRFRRSPAGPPPACARVGSTPAGRRFGATIAAARPAPQTTA